MELQKMEFSESRLKLLRDTICKGSSQEELDLFVSVCAKTGLDPFMRQIHAVKRYNGTTKGYMMTIQTGIDGYRLVAERTGAYAGSDDPQYVEGQDGKFPLKATVTVWKLVGGHKCSFTASAIWSEYAPYYNNTLSGMWAKMPRLMLGKCAEALALRKAFPQELSGVYTDAEMPQPAQSRIPQQQAPVKNKFRWGDSFLVSVQDTIERANKDKGKLQLLIKYIEENWEKNGADPELVEQALFNVSKTIEENESNGANELVADVLSEADRKMNGGNK